MPNRLREFKDKFSKDVSVPEDVQTAIIDVESSGRPDAVGDIGSKGGDSRGLMQIQAETARGLYNKGLLPKSWKGKKVKKNRLPELLLDPEFNKIAGNVLYDDNSNIIRRKAENEGIRLTPEELQNLAIKSHNQGVTRTIQRDLLNREPLNPRVQQYLKKVKDRLGKNNFQEGGIADSQDEGFVLDGQIVPSDMETIPITPPVDIQQSNQLTEPDYAQLMSEYEKEKQKYEQDRKQAVLGDFASQVSKAVSEYGIKKAAADAQRASGFRFKTPDINIPATNLMEQLKRPELQDQFKKLQLLKGIRDLKTQKGIRTTKIETISEGKPVTQLINSVTGELIKEFDTKKKDITPYQKRILDLQERQLKEQEKARSAREKASEANRKQREEKEERIRNVRKKQFDLQYGKAINTIKKDYTNHPVMKEVFKQKLAFAQVDGLLQEIERGNTVATSALGTKMARAMGEVGVLTDADVIRYIQSAQLTQKAQDRLALYFKGRLSKPTKEDLKHITQIMRIGAKNEIRPIMDQFIQSGINIGLTEEQAKDKLFGTELGRKTFLGQKPAPYGDEVEKEGKLYKWNPIKGKYQIKR